MNEGIPKYTVTLRASFALFCAMSAFLVTAISIATNDTYYFVVHPFFVFLLSVTSMFYALPNGYEMS